MKCKPYGEGQGVTRHVQCVCRGSLADKQELGRGAEKAAGENASSAPERHVIVCSGGEERIAKGPIDHTRADYRAVGRHDQPRLGRSRSMVEIEFPSTVPPGTIPDCSAMPQIRRVSSIFQIRYNALEVLSL